MTDSDRDALLAENVLLREALEAFVPDETTAGILWRDLPGSATGTVTVTLAHYRRARKALASTPRTEAVARVVEAARLVKRDGFIYQSAADDLERALAALDGDG